MIHVASPCLLHEVLGPGNLTFPDTRVRGRHLSFRGRCCRVGMVVDGTPREVSFFVRLLHRRRDEATREIPDEEPPLLATAGTRDEDLRREVRWGSPTLERWDLVESRWNLGSVVVVLSGAALAVLGVVAAVRTGIDKTWYQPVERVAGLRHSPLLAAVEAGVGVVLVLAGLAGRRGLAAVVGVAGAIAAGVAGREETRRIAQELALQRWWAITLAVVGAALAVISMVPWPHFIERHYTHASRFAPSAASDALTPIADRGSGHLTGRAGHDVPPGGPPRRPRTVPADTTRRDRCPTTTARPSSERSATAQHSNERQPPRQDPPPAGCQPLAHVDQRDGVVIVTPLTTLGDPLPAGLVEQLETIRTPSGDHRPEPDRPDIRHTGHGPGRMGARRQCPARPVLCRLSPRHRPGTAAQMARHPVPRHLRVDR